MATTTSRPNFIPAQLNSVFRIEGIPRLQVQGHSLSSGTHSQVELIWDAEGDGPVLDWVEAGICIPKSAFGRLQPKALRQTVVTVSERPQCGMELCEHAFAAWLFFARYPVRFHVMNSALPLLDGSALPWRAAMQGLAAEKGMGPMAPEEYACDLQFEAEFDAQWGHGLLRAQPAERFSVHYEIHRGDFHSAYTLQDASLAYDAILPARTFIFADDLWHLQQQGFLKGAVQDSGLLLAATASEAKAARDHWALSETPDGTQVREAFHSQSDSNRSGLVYPAEYRFPDEPARHKILDLMGDLALHHLRLPKLSITAINAGHELHHELLRRIRSLG